MIDRGRRILFAGLLAMFCGWLIGCNIGVPLLYLVDGPPKTDAAFKPADVPTVVFVDDRGNVMSRVALRSVIGDAVASELMANKVLKKTISTKDAVGYARSRESKSELLPIDAIGKAVSADQVIYVEMTSFTIGDPNSDSTPRAACQVRVVDVVNRQRTFPPGDDEDAKSYPVSVQLRPIDPEMYRSSTSFRGLEEQLAAELSDAIAKLFYKHETRETGKNLGVR